jgi:hypothetical protein
VSASTNVQRRQRAQHEADLGAGLAGLDGHDPALRRAATVSQILL